MKKDPPTLKIPCHVARWTKRSDNNDGKGAAHWCAFLKKKKKKPCNLFNGILARKCDITCVNGSENDNLENQRKCRPAVPSACHKNQRFGFLSKNIVHPFRGTLTHTPHTKARPQHHLTNFTSFSDSLLRAENKQRSHLMKGHSPPRCTSSQCDIAGRTRQLCADNSCLSRRPTTIHILACCSHCPLLHVRAVSLAGTMANLDDP